MKVKWTDIVLVPKLLVFCFETSTQFCVTEFVSLIWNLSVHKFEVYTVPPCFSQGRYVHYISDLVFEKWDTKGSKASNTLHVWPKSECSRLNDFWEQSFILRGKNIDHLNNQPWKGSTPHIIVHLDWKKFELWYAIV